MQFWSEAKRLSYVMEPRSFLMALKGLGFDLPSTVTPETFRDRYRRNVCDSSGWPKQFPLIDERSVQEGIPVFSISGKIEGRTTGNRRKCAACKCPGWFVEVQWETGQRFWPCSEGWHYDPTYGDKGRIDIIGGGEISARFISPKPLGTHPLERSAWPSKSKLRMMRGWRIDS